MNMPKILNVKKGFASAIIFIIFVIIATILFIIYLWKNGNPPLVQNTPLNGIQDMTDYKKALDIPRYPNASSWVITTNNGFPDGQPMAEIKFVTKDDTKTVFTYYKNELPKRNIPFVVYTKFDPTSPNYKGVNGVGEIAFRQGLTNFALTSQNNSQYSFLVEQIRPSALQYLPHD